MAETFNFKGFKQVKLETFNEIQPAEKKGYMWLVQEYSGETAVHQQIYFGTRLYAEVNSDAEDNQKIQNIIDSLGTMVDEDGKWQGFGSWQEILGDSGITSTEEALSALENAILNEIDAREAAISAETIAREEAIEAEAKAREEADEAEAEAREAAISAETIAREAKDEELEERIEDLEKEITSAHTKDIEELRKELREEEEIRYEDDLRLASAITENSEDIEALQEDVKELKELGPLHFEGRASAISEDNKTIILEDGTEVKASDDKGAVYVINHKEYASNGEVWVELGDESGLDKEIEERKEADALIISALTEEEAERKEADANLQDQINEKELEIQELKAKLEADENVHIISGDDVESYDDGEAEEVTASELNNVAANGGTLELQSNVVNNTLIKLGE